VGRESDDRKSAESPRMRMQWLLKTVFRVRSKSFCNFTWQVQTLSISLKFRPNYFYDKFCSYRGFGQTTIKCDKLSLLEIVDNNIKKNPVKFLKYVSYFRKKRHISKNTQDFS
jgi:hypothetical protein